MVSKSEFDQLVRSEINKAGARGGEQDARDRVAKRLNAQEGRSRNSSAYRPSPDRSATSRGTGGGRSRGGGNSGTSGKVPRPGNRPPEQGINLPAEVGMLPQPRPTDTAEAGGSMRDYILPLLMGAGLLYGGSKLMRPGQPGHPPQRPPRYPWEGGGAGDTATPVRTTPQPAAPVATPLNAPERTLALPPPAEIAAGSAGGVTEGDINRFMTEGEIREKIRQNAISQRINAPFETPSTGEVGARSGPNVYRPGVDVPAARPGFHGTRFGQPKLIIRP